MSDFVNHPASRVGVGDHPHPAVVRVGFATEQPAVFQLIDHRAGGGAAHMHPFSQPRLRVRPEIIDESEQDGLRKIDPQGFESVVIGLANGPRGGHQGGFDSSPGWGVEFVGCIRLCHSCM